MRERERGLPLSCPSHFSSLPFSRPPPPSFSHPLPNNACNMLLIYAIVYCCFSIGVSFKNTGSQNPAAPSLVRLGENCSDIMVNSNVGSASCKQIALETPQIPAPIIATFLLREAIFRTRAPASLRAKVNYISCNIKYCLFYTWKCPSFFAK